jgi:hypothetical protein
VRGANFFPPLRFACRRGTPLPEEKTATDNFMFYIILFFKEGFFIRIQGCPESGIYIALKMNRLQRRWGSLGRFFQIVFDSKCRIR